MPPRLRPITESEATGRTVVPGVTTITHGTAGIFGVSCLSDVSARLGGKGVEIGYANACLRKLSVSVQPIAKSGSLSLRVDLKYYQQGL